MPSRIGYASRADREISSCFSLVVDQRALGDRADQDFKQLGVHESSPRPGRPAPDRRRARTGRYQQRSSAKLRILPHPSRSSGSRVAPGSARSAATEAMVVRKRMRDGADAQRAQRVEEPLADCRCRPARARRRRRNAAAPARDAGGVDAVERRRRRASSRARRATPPRAIAVAARARRPRRPSRGATALRAAARQAAPAVAEAARRVDHRDLDVAREAQVLQPVVGKDHVALGMRRQQRAMPRPPDRAATATGKPARASSTGSSPASAGSIARDQQRRIAGRAVRRP